MQSEPSKDRKEALGKQKCQSAKSEGPTAPRGTAPVEDATLEKGTEHKGVKGSQEKAQDL